MSCVAANDGNAGFNGDVVCCYSGRGPAARNGIEEHATDFHVGTSDVGSPGSVEAEFDLGGLGQVLDFCLITIKLEGEIDNIGGAAFEDSESRGGVGVIFVEDRSRDGALLAVGAEREGSGEMELASARRESDGDVGKIVSGASETDEFVSCGFDRGGLTALKLSGGGTADVDGDLSDFGSSAAKSLESCENCGAVIRSIDGIAGNCVLVRGDVASVAEGVDDVVGAGAGGNDTLGGETECALNGRLALSAGQGVSGVSADDVAKGGGSPFLDLAASGHVDFQIGVDGEERGDAVEFFLILVGDGGFDVVLGTGDGAVQPLETGLCERDGAGGAGDDRFVIIETGEHDDDQISRHRVSTENRSAEINSRDVVIEGSERNGGIGVVDLGKESETEVGGVDSGEIGTDDAGASEDAALTGKGDGFAHGTAEAANSGESCGDPDFGFGHDAEGGECSVQGSADDADQIPASAKEVV